MGSSTKREPSPRLLLLLLLLLLNRKTGQPADYTTPGARCLLQQLQQQQQQQCCSNCSFSRSNSSLVISIPLLVLEAASSRSAGGVPGDRERSAASPGVQAPHQIPPPCSSSTSNRWNTGTMLRASQRDRETLGSRDTGREVPVQH